MSIGSRFEGARVSHPATRTAFSMSKEINVVVGTTEAVLARPDWARFIAMHVDAGAFMVRPGNYTQLQFNSTSDVDGTQETAVITGVEARMSTLPNGVKVFGPVQLSVSSGALPTGLSADTSYWIAKPLDAGVATDEVAFYLTESAAQAAGTGPANDDRIGLTAAVGVTNFAGMANNALGAIPAATVTDGYSSLHLNNTAGAYLTWAAPQSLTVKGLAAGSVLTYWWLPA